VSVRGIGFNSVSVEGFFTSSWNVFSGEALSGAGPGVDGATPLPVFGAGMMVAGAGATIVAGAAQDEQPDVGTP
jgi:hypothetical protein